MEKSQIVEIPMENFQKEAHVADSDEKKMFQHPNNSVFIKVF